MKTTITESDFIRDFERIRPKHFSHDGLKALFAYLGEFEEQTGDEIEFDVIGLCCDFAEYNNIDEFNADYNTEYNGPMEITETMVIPVSSEGFIVEVF